MRTSAMLQPSLPSDLEPHTLSYPPRERDGTRGNPLRLDQQESSAVDTSIQQPGGWRRVLRALGRRKWILLVTTSVSVGLGIVDLQFTAPVYTSSARLIVQPTFLQNPADAADEGFLRSQEQVITSTPVLAAALSTPGVREASALSGRLDSIKFLKQHLRIETRVRGSLLSISYDAPTSREANSLVSAVIQAYVRFQSGMRDNMADGSLAVLQTEKAKLQTEFNTHWADLQAFGRAHGLAAGDEAVDASQKALHEMAITVAQANVQTVAARASYDELQRQLADDPKRADKLNQLVQSNPAINGDVSTLDAQLSAARADLAGIELKYLPHHPALLAVARRVDDLQAARDLLVQRQWEAAVRHELDLQKSYAQQQALTAQEANTQQEYLGKKASIAELQKSLAGLDARRQELERAASIAQASATVIEPPATLDRPARPHSALILTIMTVAGVGIGAGLALFRDGQADAVAHPERKLLAAGLPVLGQLPPLPRRALSFASSRDRLSDDAAIKLFERLLDSLGGISPACGGVTLLITSTTAREGKSTLASSFAMHLATSGHRTLLVDANLFSPAQGGIFGIAGELGLFNLIDAQGETSFGTAVSATDHDKLDLLLPGSCEELPEELLNSHRFSDLLSDLAGEYDFVLVDAPAVSDSSDARIIASSCDATVVVSQQAKLNRKTLEQTRASLSNVGGNVVGMIINAGTEAVRPSRALVHVELPQQIREQVIVSRRVPIVEPKLPDLAEVDGMQSAPASMAAMAPMQPTEMQSARAHVHAIACLLGNRLPATHRGLLGLTGALTVGAVLSALVQGTTSLLKDTAAFEISIAEVVALGAVLFAVWSILQRAQRARIETLGTDGLIEKCLTAFAHASAMSALFILMALPGTRMLSLAAVAGSSFAAALLAQQVMRSRSSLPFWISPLCVGLVGYAVAAMPQTSGILHAYLAVLSRPFPLDYAGAGTTAALLGYAVAGWGSKRDEAEAAA